MYNMYNCINGSVTWSLMNRIRHQKFEFYKIYVVYAQFRHFILLERRPEEFVRDFFMRFDYRENTEIIGNYKEV